MDTSFVKSPEVQKLLDRAAGIEESGGNPRLKAIMRDLIESAMTVIVKHDVSESEFWLAVKYLAEGSGELGLIVPGIGLEHFIDLFLDAKDTQAGRVGGTPRTIEGPLYVAGAPLVEGDAALTVDPDEGAHTLYMSGAVTGPDGEPVENAIVHVWHANSQGWYSHFDPTGEQTPFNNRRRIKLGKDGRYAFHSKQPSGYSVPPGGATDQLMQALGRHGNRPAHVHFFIEAPGYRTLTTQINFGDDPFAADDFAFGTREGLLPVPNRQGDAAYIAFDFQLQRASDAEDEGFSARARAAAEPVDAA
ncbi:MULTISPECIES: dioxygenase [unclassified Novosphingobium]|uniref:dioxygenase family protein n=1 Tax=unclassified Novosphingobium TaxID=2644732 RepID=UPI000D30F240|nr:MULTISPECIES: dioxygenase [unclassified Novosphingobium]PTR07678.1 catechol 1,2-dioxygenase [Novosphingobium sp. GV055]PUB00364.1 catechol 1,2-dioxygenase [Novosphingobium sp. GV061]PUB15703.1 catechol 1,2-dioxygenase [Novosphingobium sp. GV079]PUB39390.1 catechol 1,2-dioxygenase [Novosphingobium sp. GV027]